MKKLLVFDLDGTLCPFNRPMEHTTIDTLRKLEAEGYRIAICSGKPVYYLTGFARQIGLEAPVLAGENGGTVQFGIVMPNKTTYDYPVSDAAREQLEMVRKAIDARLSEDEIWYQPNRAEVTPFVSDVSQLDIIGEIADSLELPDLVVYRHIDCYDFIPVNINKGNGVKFIAELVGAEMEDVIAFGDAINDIPMFEVAGTSVLIGNGLDYEADYRFDNITDALNNVRTM